MRVLITGAAGYLGSLLLEKLATRPDLELLATDLRPPTDLEDYTARAAGRLHFEPLDLRDGAAIDKLVGRFKPEIVVHLAAVVDPKAPRRLAFEVDVEGTKKLVRACLEAQTRRLVTTSSGAAYGYRASHPRWIDEDTPLGADEAFAYAWHKRLVEEWLAELRRERPELEQVMLRPGTALGRGVETPVTRLFEGRFLLGVRGGDDRFVFIWDRDAARALEHALDGPVGVFNLAGDGALSMAAIAKRLGAVLVRVPSGPLASVLWLGRRVGLPLPDPAQISFLKYRPVLSNRRLKEDFGFTPEKNSAEAFEVYAAARPRPRRSQP